ncbi:MAG: hypothetical protein RIQ79_710 [Verrucomicrobiota bacterium]
MTPTASNVHVLDTASNRRRTPAPSAVPSAPAFTVELAEAAMDQALQRLERTLAAMKRGPYRRIGMGPRPR